ASAAASASLLPASCTTFTNPVSEKRAPGLATTLRATSALPRSTRTSVTISLIRTRAAIAARWPWLLVLATATRSSSVSTFDFSTVLAASGIDHPLGAGKRDRRICQLFRGVGLGAGRRAGPRLRPLDVPDGPDRALVEQHQRQGEGELAEHVGRREHGGDHEGADDEIAPLRLELLGGDDADAAEQGEDHRQLEGDAEGEDQLHHQGQVILDLG